MDGYLVVARQGMDDIPVSLHATYAEAKAAAMELARDPAPVMASLEEFTDGGTWQESESLCCAAVVHFVGGRPVKTTFVTEEGGASVDRRGRRLTAAPGRAGRTARPRPPPSGPGCTLPIHIIIIQISRRP
jgi:hypothetical protein